MKILTKTNEKIVFVEEMTDSLANAIRRSVSEIPTLAIDEVEIFKNDSVLYDEVLGLRLGLLPLATPDDMELKEECSCKGKGCSKCMVELKLVAKGPGYIHAKDLKGKAEVVYPEMPLVYLREDQELELVATAVLGKGKDHTKYSPALAYYRNAVDIESGNCKDCEKCVKTCPKGLLKIEKGKIELTNKYECDDCELCVEECKRQGSDGIVLKPGKEIIFTIESFGQSKAEEVLANSVKALKENLKQISK